MIKRMILTLAVILCLGTSAYSQDAPSVTYQSYSHISNDRIFGTPSLVRSESEDYNVAIGEYNRNLNKNKSVLASNIEYYKPHIIEKQNYNIIRFYDGRIRWRQGIVGIYILNKQDIIVGYCLIEKIGDLKSANFLSTSPVIAQMRALTNNNSFLQNNLTIPANVTVNFYEQDHGTFIERYGFAEDNTYEEFVMDAFYPKEVENDLIPFIKQALNANFSEFLLQ